MQPSEFVAAFRDFIASHGVPAPDHIHLDGERYYFSTHPTKSYKKGGWYRVYWDNRPTGVFGDFRTDTYAVFVPGGSVRELSPEQAAAFKAEIEAQKKARAREQRARQVRATARAVQTWEGLPKADSNHPYLKAKGVLSHHLRWHKPSNRIFIPIRDRKGNLRTLQSISPSGGKLFWTGAPLRNHYYSIGKPDPEGVMWICEGYATGASIAQATHECTVMTFASFNLEPVAKIMREKWGPSLTIIIAGDNDAATPGNPGVTAARAAAKACGGFVAIPPVLDKNGKNDWNDVYQRRGKAMRDDLREAVEMGHSGQAALQDFEKRMMEVTTDSLAGPVNLPPEVIPDVEIDHDWKRKLLLTDKGTIIPSEANMVTLLQYDPVLTGLVSYDSFKCQVMITRPPPWPTATLFFPTQLVDKDRTQLLMHFQRRGIAFQRRTIDEGLRSVADWRSHDPLKELIDNLPQWDGQERIGSWLVDYCGAAEKPFVRAAGRAFLIGAIARALKPGCKVDTTLVLEGPQGTFKSTLVRTLAMRDHFFSDAFPNLASERYPEMMLRGHWIIEVPELSGINKAEINRIKEFLSRSEDRSRDPYGTAIEERPRRCVFVATTNQSAYLRDPTGARRFWPIRTRTIDIKAFQRDVQQLWAEALVAYHAGEDWHLSRDMERLQRIEADQRQVNDPILSMISGYIAEHKCTGLSPSELLWDLVSDKQKTVMARQHRSDLTRITDALLSLGWVKVGRSRRCRKEIGTYVEVWTTREIAMSYGDEMSQSHMAELTYNWKYWEHTQGLFDGPLKDDDFHATH